MVRKQLAVLTLAAVVVGFGPSGARAAGGAHGAGGGHAFAGPGGFGHGYGNGGFGRGYGYGGFGRGYGFYGYPGFYGFGLGLGLGYGLGYGYGYGYPYGYPYPYPVYVDVGGAAPPPAPCPPGGVPAAQAPAPASPLTPTSASSGPVRLTDTDVLLSIRVPPDAVVRINGAQTAQNGPRREFMSSGLLPGRNYTFLVTAHWTGPNGQGVDVERRVSVQGGERRNVDFYVTSAPAE